MSQLLASLFDPLTLITAAAAAVIVARWFSDDVYFGGETICAFLAAWLARPLLMVLFAFTLDETSFLAAAAMLNLFGGALCGAAFATIGALTYKYASGNG